MELGYHKNFSQNRRCHSPDLKGVSPEYKTTLLSLQRPVGSQIICSTFKMFPEINLFLRTTKQYNHLSYISFKIVPLCKYTLQPATIKVLETFLEVIF